MKVLCVTLFSLFFIQLCTSQEVQLKTDDLEVRFAAVIFRHGDRTPIDPYPTDPWKNPDIWPVGFGELTNTGKQQHFALGKFLRKKYNELLSKKYNPKEIYIRSTDVDRTLMSAEANLAGLYPPVNGSVWNKDIPWQPIPVHTTPNIEDNVLAMGKQCSVYDHKLKTFMSSNEYQRKLANEKKLLEYLTNKTGRSIKSFSDIEYIYNTLFIENLYNLTLPSWTHTVFPNRMSKPSVYSFVIATATPVLARLKVGPLLKEITSKMQAVYRAENKSSNNIHKSTINQLKMMVYSAHDNTIANMLNALNLFEPHFPSYTASLHFELVFDKSTKDFSVQILYRNVTALVEPTLLEIPNCGTTCPLDHFLSIYSELIPENWEAECKNKSFHLLSFGLILIGCMFSYHSYQRINKFYKNTHHVVPVAHGTDNVELLAKETVILRLS